MRRVLLLLVMLAAGATAAYAQDGSSEEFDLVIRGVPLSRALEQLAFTTGIDLVYTSDAVAGKVSYCSGRNLPADELLSCVLKGSDLDYVRSSSGAYVLFEAVATAPRFGHLAGRIIDADTGEPLPYANVLLADAQTGTSTNESGLFSIASLLSGPHRVVVTYVGYESATDSVWIGPGEHRRIHIALKSAESTLAPVVVDGLTQRLPSGRLGRSNRASAELRSVGATATTDVTRGLTSIAGIAVQQPLADLHIQGGSAGEHATYLDGAPVRDPVSLGRYLSAFSPLALGRITVHKAGFGASAGSNLSGVVDVQHDVSSMNGERLSFSVDPLSVNGRAESRLHLPGGVDGAAMVAARGSVWGAFQDPAVNALLDSWTAVDPLVAPTSFADYPPHDETELTTKSPGVRFSDLHGGVRLNLSPFRTLYASAYRARNRLVSDFASSRSGSMGNTGRMMLARDEYDWTNWVGQIRHSWLLGARATIATQLVGSWNESRYGYYGLYDSSRVITSLDELIRVADARRSEVESNPGALEDNDIREIEWRSSVTYSASSRHQIDANVSATHTKSHFLFDNELVDEIAHVSEAWLVTGAVEGSHHIGLGTVVEPGVRLTYLPNRRSAYAEPRLAVRHDASAGRLGALAVRVAGGLYRQYVNQLDVTSTGATSLVPTSMVWLPLDGSLSPPRALHLAADVLIMPSPSWTISVEAFRKWQHRLLVLDYASIADTELSTPPAPLSRQRDFVASASGDVRGFNVRVRNEAGPVHQNVTYSYVQAERRYENRFNGAAQPVPWNTPHRLTADLTAHVTKRISMIANWEGGWGRKWALRRSYYDYLAFHVPPSNVAPFDLQNPSDTATPAYYRLDAGLSVRTRLSAVEAELRFFVTNLTNRRNVYDYSLRSGTDAVKSIPRTLPGRHLFFSARFTY